MHQLLFDAMIHLSQMLRSTDGEQTAVERQRFSSLTTDGAGAT